MEAPSVDDGLRPIHRHALRGDWPALCGELAAGVSVAEAAGPVADDKLLSRERATPLHLAAQGGHGEVCALLLRRQAYVDARDHEGRTALHYALCLGEASPEARAEVVGTLLAGGATPGAQDASGHTPLHLAARAGLLQVVVLLVRRGAEVDPVDRFGTRPVQLAHTAGHDAVVRYLLGAGAGAVDA